MAVWSVVGSFLARRGYWQPFSMHLSAEGADAARERAFSRIGGCHGIGRRWVRITTVSEETA